MIYLEKSAAGSKMAEFLDKKGRSIIEVEDGFTPENSKENILITSQRNTFVHKCPATKIYRCCGLNVADVIEGCPFDCTYCILQSYLNHEYIKVYGNLDGIEEEMRAFNSQGKGRLCTGELSDSLALDGMLGLSEFFVPIANQLDNIQFELKTKSACVDRLLKLNPKNIIISFSLNPQEIITKEEHGTANLKNRLNAAKMCAEHGYRLAFHFDPIIYYDNFENGYRELIKELTSVINQDSVEYISMSTFRFMPELITIIRDKFDRSILTGQEYITSLDGKMRYPKHLRSHMLKTVVRFIKSDWKDVFIYFCMEHSSIWEKIFGGDPGERDELEALFPHYRAKS